MGLLALLVLAGFLAVTSVAFRSSRAIPPQRIALIGDSITDQARDVYQTELPPAYTLDIEAVPGRRFVDMLPLAREAAAARPNQVVIDLGSNDVLLDEPDESTDQAMGTMLDLYATAPCVHVVTVNEGFVFAPTQGPKARRINDQLRRIATERGYRIVDWNKIVVDYVAAGAPQGPITADSVHPTAVGKSMLVDAVRASLAACRGSAS